jgi:hypothetical protein
MTSVSTFAAPLALNVRYDRGTRELIVLFDPDAAAHQLLLMDAAGRLCGQWSTQRTETRIALPDIAPGVYTLSASGMGQWAVPFRFVVQ